MRFGGPWVIHRPRSTPRPRPCCACCASRQQRPRPHKPATKHTRTESHGKPPNRDLLTGLSFGCSSYPRYKPERHAEGASFTNCCAPQRETAVVAGRSSPCSLFRSPCAAPHLRANSLRHRFSLVLGSRARVAASRPLRDLVGHTVRRCCATAPLGRIHFWKHPRPNDASVTQVDE